jgi:single-strand DNA-binding protein
MVGDYQHETKGGEMLNQVTLIGNLGRDPEGFDTRNGRGCRLSVATTYKPKDGEEQTEWHRVILFGQPADFALDYLAKGRQVFVQGRLKTSSYEKDGQKHYATDIIASRVNALGPKPADSKSATTGVSGASTFADDDVPF